MTGEANVTRHGRLARGGLRATRVGRRVRSAGAVMKTRRSGDQIKGSTDGDGPHEAHTSRKDGRRDRFDGVRKDGWTDKERD